MPRYKLSPHDPTGTLLARIETILRSGPANCAAINPSPPAWAAGAAAPDGHFLFPQGTRLYVSDERESIVCTPMAVIIGTRADLQEKSEELQDAYNIALSIKVRTGADYDPAEMKSVVKGIQWYLFRPLVLDDDSTQQPQARLTTSGLLVYGSTWRDNFDGLSVSQIAEEEQHPELEIMASVVCSEAFPPGD